MKIGPIDPSGGFQLNGDTEDRFRERFPPRYPHYETVARRFFNPKRELAEAGGLTLEQRERWASRVRYGGNPEHKRNPGDFGLTPPAGARMGKTLCDTVQVFAKDEALELLRVGLRQGLVSEQQRNGWPQNVWVRTAKGEWLEAQLEGEGVYHGYPMPENDPFREIVARRVGP